VWKEGGVYKLGFSCHGTCVGNHKDVWTPKIAHCTSKEAVRSVCQAKYPGCVVDFA